MQSVQISLPGLDFLQAAVEKLAEAGVEERGAVFTRREVVEFILDLAGYTSAEPLHTKRLLEPSFGHGDFLLVAVERLLTAFHAQVGTKATPAELLQPAIRAVELHRQSFGKTRRRLSLLLRKHGVPQSQREALLKAWLIQGDFLLEFLPCSFSHIIGNPPYVRQELIPSILLTEYRRRYRTMYDRADLYIPFIEKSLSLLAPGGVIGFICSDRWMKNRYGGPLRELVSREFHLKHYVDMVDTPAFHTDVTAYPAITVITRDKSQATRVAHRPAIDRENLKTLAKHMVNLTVDPDSPVKEVFGIAQGKAPWVLESFAELAIVRRLEAEYPTLGEAGCKVGIGVATGADKVYVRPLMALDVEPERKLPLVMTRDIASGVVKWTGQGVINPFEDDGTVASFKDYPKFAAYMEKHAAQIKRRNVAKRNPTGWYRTIDRIYRAVAATPKLLIPDIKGDPNIVYEDGRLYPHHNLYYITSEEWDLRALQAVLMSGIARLFISTYSTRMRGGYLRYQAQYLRRIRIPYWKSVPPDIRAKLVDAAQQANIPACNGTVFDLYGLSPDERSAVVNNHNHKTN